MQFKHDYPMFDNYDPMWLDLYVPATMVCGLFYVLYLIVDCPDGYWAGISAWGSLFGLSAYSVMSLMGYWESARDYYALIAFTLGAPISLWLWQFWLWRVRK